VRLRRLAKAFPRSSADADLGRVLARKVAQRVHVSDQGRVVIRAGARHVPGSSIRRKVLALLCLLLSRPEKALTRDQVLDALWPDLDPAVAVNSLNQTVYFLRRVLEEDYVEDNSPGYVHHDSDVLWLDPELVTSDSTDCWKFLRSMPERPTPDEVEQLVEMYRGRFALDFEYEEWATAYRDSLHASYLEVVEQAVRADLESAHFERGIRIGRRALELDPRADLIEVTLLRLYRQTGAHAAAAEQYSHYAGVHRDEVGVDPPPLESL
jgi:DNA-binding SARP family transcriptional activator